MANPLPTNSRWANLDSERGSRGNSNQGNSNSRNNQRNQNTPNNNNNNNNHQQGKGKGSRRNEDGGGGGGGGDRIREDITKKNESVLAEMQPGMVLQVKSVPGVRGLMELVACSPSPSAAQNESRKNFLIVLDLNGVLVDRKAYNQRSNHNNKKEPFAPRPFLNEFLDFCFKFFHVALWSCGKLSNMELELFEGRELVTVFHQKDSTSCWPRTSIVSPEKVFDYQTLHTHTYSIQTRHKVHAVIEILLYISFFSFSFFFASMI
jgi:hypothetical protein